jgi:uncharacterized protein YcbK (DUF882 family)
MKLKIAKDELEFDQKPTLNKNFWDGEKLNPEVKDAIMAVVESYLKSTNLELTVDDIDEIEFTGSLANYNYSKFSDVDIHLLFDFSKLSKDPDFMRELLTAKAIIWNDRNNVTIFGHEAEFYITDAGTDHHSTGVYSVKNNEWLVKPIRDPKLSAELNLNKVKDKADKISKEIDMLVVKDELSLEKLEKLKDKIKKMRVAGLETGGEFSTENLAFKLLRRRGELNTLYSLMQQARDEELSLDEDMEWWKKRRSLDNKNYRELMGYVGDKGVFKRKYAAKNIGYPKSVSRRKLSKMGPPYTVDPQMKLPKSGPPGVGSLEEQKDAGTLSILGASPVSQQIIDRIIDNILTGSGDGDEIKISFREYSDTSTGSKIPCLLPHSYEIKKVGEDYNVSVSGKDYKKYFHPEALKINFDPTVCLFDKRTSFKISDFELINWISNELKKASISRIDYKPADKSKKAVSYTGSEVAPKISKKQFKKLLSLPGPSASVVDPVVLKLAKTKKRLKLVLFPTRSFWFMTDLFDILKTVKTSGVMDAISKIDFVYYTNEFYYQSILPPDGKAQLERSVPGEEIKNKLVNKIVDVLVKNTPSVGGFQVPRSTIETAVNEMFENVGLDKITDSFTKKEYLSNLQDNIRGGFCKSFDCSKSTIQFNKDEKPMPIIDWAGKSRLKKQLAKTPGAAAIGNLIKVADEVTEEDFENLDPVLKQQLLKLTLLARQLLSPSAQMVITEALRPPDHPGPAPHKQGKAVDFYFKGATWMEASCLLLAAIAAGKIQDGGFGIYFKEGGKTLSSKPHYDVTRSRAWKWIGGKQAVATRRSKKSIIKDNLLKLPDNFRDLALSYYGEMGG